MLGSMMDMPLNISAILRHAARHHGDTEIVSRETTGGIHRYTYRDAHRRSRQLARALLSLGYVCWRPNFRGVGDTEGTHDEGRGETDDMLAVIEEAKRRCGDIPVVLAGFSFGGFVQTRVAKRLAAANHPIQRMVLVGTAAGFVEGTRSYDTEAVPNDTIVIHGSTDETVPLANVLKWAEPLELPVVVVPGADHFFHRRLHVIREIITRSWRH